MKKDLKKRKEEPELKPRAVDRSVKKKKYNKRHNSDDDKFERKKTVKKRRISEFQSEPDEYEDEQY